MLALYGSALLPLWGLAVGGDVACLLRGAAPLGGDGGLVGHTAPVIPMDGSLWVGKFAVGHSGSANCWS